jgi:hypothetical protein
MILKGPFMSRIAQIFGGASIGIAALTTPALAAAPGQAEAEAVAEMTRQDGFPVFKYYEGQTPHQGIAVFHTTIKGQGVSVRYVPKLCPDTPSAPVTAYSTMQLSPDTPKETFQVNATYISPTSVFYFGSFAVGTGGKVWSSLTGTQETVAEVLKQDAAKYGISPDHVAATKALLEKLPAYTQQLAPVIAKFDQTAFMNSIRRTRCAVSPAPN